MMVQSLVGDMFELLLNPQLAQYATRLYSLYVDRLKLSFLRDFLDVLKHLSRW
jgi:hypothetical protein